ncbi:MAG: efflux RND transporter periplasmic adaptor subunit [Cyanobacteria bacterium P01_H01_bin.152]
MSPLQNSDLTILENAETSLSKGPPKSSSGYGKLLVGIGVGVAIALIGSRVFSGNPNAADEPPAADEVSQISAQTVALASAQPGLVSEELTVTGTVQAADLLAVTPPISGLQVRDVLVEEGDRVAAGQPLVILDDIELRTQIEQAQAQIDVAQAQLQQQRASLSQSQARLAEAEANRQRYQSLAEQGAVSSEELDSRATQAITAREDVGVAAASITSAEANVRSQQSALARLQTQLNQTTVVAPLAGIVAERPASVGSVSSTSNAVVSLIQGNQLELLAEVPQVQLSQVPVGAAVNVTSRTDSNIQVEGTVQEIQPLVDPETRTAQVIIGLPASDRLRSGMFLTAAIQSGQRSGLTVPATALLPQSDGSFLVYVVGPDQVAMARTVETGALIPGVAEADDRVEILQGLESGEQVITAGAGFVQEGDVVTVAE